MAKKLKQLAKNLGEIQPPTERRRWVRNSELAKYLGVSKMTIWRFKHDLGFDFPPAAVINRIEFNDLDKVDAWMEARVQSEEEVVSDDKRSRPPT
jgi:predicted DNA-binding transcriptional regulator AlpA